MWNIQHIRHAAGIRNIPPGTTTLAVADSFTMIVELQRDTDDVAAVVLKHSSNDGRIDATRHGDDHTRICLQPMNIERIYFPHERRIPPETSAVVSAGAERLPRNLAAFSQSSLFVSLPSMSGAHLIAAFNHPQPIRPSASAQKFRLVTRNEIAIRAKLKLSTSFSGIVDGVEMSGADVVLTSGSQSGKLDQVIPVKLPSTL